ncbi:hypothetical protein N0V90_003243 [Kalmusia sp. IMI 367209]|nr:hypothetical protein N0V90_003243 [Kalmusia sp. IMI 367209]
MDTAQHQRQFKQNHLPPSPPPSPPTARRRHKKKDQADPFLQLGYASDPILSQPPPSPANDAELPEEPLYRRIIVTPFLFTSFLLSLFLIDTRNAITRTKNSTFFSFLNPEPYQDPLDTTWARRGSTTHVKPPDSLNPDQRPGTEKKKRRSWHLHKKIRKIAKLEVSDAFEMRGRVMIAMIVVILTTVYAVSCLFRWILSKF